MRLCTFSIFVFCVLVQESCGASFDRVDGLSIPGAGSLFGGAEDSVRGFLYFVDDGKGEGSTVLSEDPTTGEITGYSRVFKVSADSFTIVDVLELSVNNAFRAILDSGEGVLLVFGDADPASAVDTTAVMVDLSTFSEVATRSLGSVGVVFAAVIHPGIKRAWAISETGYICTLSYDPSVPSVSKIGELNTGDTFKSVAFDGSFLYVGSNTIPGKVSKYDTATDTVAIVPAPGIVALNEGENYLSCAFMDFELGRAYFGTDSTPGYVVEVDTASMTRLRSVRLDTPLRSVVRGTNGLAYFGSQEIPTSAVHLINTSSMELIKTVETSEVRFNSAAVYNNFAYFGTQSNPGGIVKLSLSTCTNDCTDGGTCQPDGTCSCDALRDGVDCSIRLCQDNCNDRGVCDDGVCICHANYTGDLCQFRACLDGCGEEIGHGVCNDGVCDCTVVEEENGQWGGPTCDKFGFFCKPNTPNFNCSGHGYCPIDFSGRCVCDEGWRLSLYCDEDESSATFYVMELQDPLSIEEFIRLVACAANVTEDLVFVVSRDEGPPTRFVFTLRDATPGDGSSKFAVERLAAALNDPTNVCAQNLTSTFFSGQFAEAEQITETETIEGNSAGLIAGIVCSAIAVCCCAIFVPLGLYQLKLYLVKKALRDMQNDDGKAMDEFGRN